MENFIETIHVDGFKLNCIKNDSCITECIKSDNKLWEHWLEKYIKEVYEENTNMIDIGAHIGTFTLMMSKYISDKSYIYSFEPVYSEILNKNIEQNNLSEKVKVFNFGLSNNFKRVEGGFIDFSLTCNYGFTEVDTRKNFDEKSEFIINLEKLDDLNIENVSFIKIDVEGSERKVLEGSIETIHKNMPTILIEIWCTSENAIKKNKKDNTENQISCFEFLFNLGYICIPVSPNTDDFLFIHHTKKELLNKIMNIL